ncbi:unnamed protein product [Prorocentrum cordatum]|uniref:Uncharacterized protein n=1 Tax=Prorocentrum cordatum TaxID=2364126 RepID=A0ABN9PXH4_9DINO|nr:unnamed protein product [Polarella glacialis]
MQNNSVFAPAMKFISSTLQRHLQRLPYLLTYSNHFIRIISATHFSRLATVLKTDITFYCMSGTHDVLLDQSSKFLDGTDKQRFLLLLRCILDNQFVEIPGLEEDDTVVIFDGPL